MGSWVFLVHPTMASVLLFALVERCFVSRVRDFFALYSLHQDASFELLNTAFKQFFIYFIIRGDLFKSVGQMEQENGW